MEQCNATKVPMCKLGAYLVLVLDTLFSNDVLNCTYNNFIVI